MDVVARLCDAEQGIHSVVKAAGGMSRLWVARDPNTGVFVMSTSEMGTDGKDVF